MNTPNPSRPVEEPAVTPPFGPVPPIHIGRPPHAAAPAHRMSRAARAVAGRGPALLRRLYGRLTRSS